MLKYRFISGFLSVVGMILATSYLPPAGCLILLMVLSAVCLHEVYAMFEKAGVQTYKWVGYMGGFVLLAVTIYTIGPDPIQKAAAYKWEMLVLLVIVLTLFVRCLFSELNMKMVNSVAATLFGFIYVPYLLNFFARVAYGWDGAHIGQSVAVTGRLMIIYTVIVVKTTDIGAYTFGRIFGKHKLCPRVSPGKTWEGFFGGLATAVFSSWLFFHLSGGQIGNVSMELHDALILGVVLALVGVVGDLFESALKRSCEVKDSSAFVPGMGGLLDVFDSLLFGVPVLYVYVQVFM